VTDDRQGRRLTILRFLPLILIISLLAWCTTARQTQQATLPIFSELVDLFNTAGLVDSGGPIDLNKAAKRAGEVGMNRLFYDSASSASIQALRWIAAHGADPKNIGALDKGTLLQRAALKPTLDRLTYFIDELHIDPLQSTPDGIGILHLAAQAGIDNLALQYLRDKGVSLTATDRAGRQPIHYAAIKSISPLATAGADINALDSQGRTALHWAAEEGRNDAVAELIRLGASVFKADNAGNTPLHLAAIRRSDEVIDTLLSAGAPRTARNAEGFIPRELFDRSRRNRDYQSEHLNKL